MQRRRTKDFLPIRFSFYDDQFLCWLLRYRLTGTADGLLYSSVRSKRAPGVIDVRADPSDYGHSLHYVDLSALNEKQYKEFGDYDGPRLERLVIR